MEKQSKKLNTKVIAMIVGAVAIVAIIIFVLFKVFGGKAANANFAMLHKRKDITISREQTVGDLIDLAMPDAKWEDLPTDTTDNGLIRITGKDTKTGKDVVIVWNMEREKRQLIGYDYVIIDGEKDTSFLPLADILKAYLENGQ